MKPCKYCQALFSPKSEKQEFCCTKCRVYFSRKKAPTAHEKSKLHGRPKKPAYIEIAHDPKIHKDLKLISKPLTIQDDLPEKPCQHTPIKISKTTPAKGSLPDPIRSVLDRLPQYKH